MYLGFFRAVNVLGTRYKNGLAGDEEQVAPLRFYTEDVLGDDERWVFVAYNPETKRHFVVDE